MFIVPLTRRSAAFSHPLASWFDERSFDRSFDRFVAPASRTARVQRSPALDVSDEDNSYTIQLDMPGVTKGDIKVSIDGRRVSVQATAQTAEQPQPEAATTTTATATAVDRVVYSERTSASYARSFTLPTEVEQGTSSAKLENGVLTLTLVKKVAPQAAQLTVN